MLKFNDVITRNRRALEPFHWCVCRFSKRIILIIFKLIYFFQPFSLFEIHLLVIQVKVLLGSKNENPRELSQLFLI